MPYPDIFSKEVTEKLIERIQNLNSSSQPQWGKMNVAQMLAHCSVTYQYIYEDTFKQPNFFMKFILKSFVKNIVVGEKPYPKNSRTAPDFLITDERNFNVEKSRLIDFLKTTQSLGAAHFDGRESHSFGKLSKNEWNSMFYKHLDHHFVQFGV
tara:strand:- start:419 stop:877 length:459 start_codon:yes stop_codon:yes gene_type:complete